MPSAAAEGRLDGLSLFAPSGPFASHPGPALAVAADLRVLAANLAAERAALALQRGPSAELGAAIAAALDGKLARINPFVVPGGDRDGLRRQLAERCGLAQPAVERILGSGNAKALTALAWKASLPASFAARLQLKIGGIMPAELLQGRAGQGYPLSPEEMEWQLEPFS